ncbi:TadA family conjugal transfer-associated ATPase [Glutamicibacter sp.]|uniref:TadA family conjugal transfer-associated ATPase n=1 Tax=Glutamicibacter sp. TaxID=1931995 RepID=UPI0028BED0A1|nr:TadA family conjugal transfer-associated ATPase [Glutamicibacter sp.]
MSPGRHLPESAVLSAGPGLDPRILKSVRERALATGGELDAIALAGAVHDSGAALGSTGAAQSLQALQNEVSGLSVLEPFARREGVTDVLVDGKGQVWTDSPRGLEATGFCFSSAEQVRSLAVHLATLAGRRLDTASPYMDMSLNNYRIHAVIPPIATEGPLISIRVKSGRHMELAAVLEHAPGFWRPLLGAILARTQNFLITGGTGSGKTTLLQAMLCEVRPDHRLLIIEDSQELQVQHPHVISLQARSANSESTGAVQLRDLVIQALRMRPDRLIVGECRGAEIRDFLAAMNTGHQGACGTLHANHPQAVPARLASLGAMAGWNLQATSLQAASALDLIIHMDRQGQGRRSPVALGILETDAQDHLMVSTLIDTCSGTPAGPRALAIIEEKLGASVAQSVSQWQREARESGAPC